MSAHLTKEMFERMRTRAMPPDQLIAALRHLGGCAQCAALFQPHVETSTNVVRTAIGEPVPADHLDADRVLLPYVQGSLDVVDRELAESHLDECAMCRAEIADLRALAPRRRRFSFARLGVFAAAAALLLAVTALLVSNRPEPDAIPVASTTAKPAPVPAAPAKNVPAAATPARPRYARERWAALVSAAVASGRLPVSPLAAELDRPRDVMRAGSADADLDVTPSAVVLDDVRPELSWPAFDEATYVVSIFDGETRVARSASLREPRWRVERPLKRGRTYAWQVEVTTDSGLRILPASPAPPAAFHVLSAGDHEELSAARSLHPGDHLLHSVLYAGAGMRAEARAALRRAIEANDPRATLFKDAQ